MNKMCKIRDFYTNKARCLSTDFDNPFWAFLRVNRSDSYSYYKTNTRR